ncbi:GNAT family N-acetyltransferase [Cytobacillus sp. FJAT-53684]|uniref:GNAT family N-acetyltransferase n=1 Tax=Cytobacillus mangrovibacter TaxID=3299024 RepID=A0ABW6JSC6_9BACI
MNLEMIFGNFPVLESSKLVLDKIEETHLQELFTIYDNEKVFEYCGIIPKHNVQTVRKMIGHFERDFHKKSRVKWGIFQKIQRNQLVGIIESMDFSQKVNMVSIGYFLAEDYWGKGIATESVRMLVKFLFEEVNVNRIQAEVMPANEVSKKVLLKNGFMKEGLLRQAHSWSGKGVIDLEIYSILKEDYIDFTF